MDQIELECPGCQEVLEIDIGFAGGVCRCSNCGTLMTVPTPQTESPAGRSTRPAAPGRPDRPGAPGPAAERPAAPQRPERPAAPAAPEPPAPAPAEAAESEVEAEIEVEPEVTAEQGPLKAEAITVADDGSYVTESGKEIEITDIDKVAVARRKRKAIRWTTMAVFFIVMAIVVAACVFAIVIILNAADQEPDIPGLDPDNPDIALVEGYDPDANPYLMQEPNLLGVPMESTSTIVIDASGASRTWFSYVTFAVLQGTKNVNDEKLQIILATEAGPVKYPEGAPAVLDATRADAIQGFFDSHRATGAASLAPAVAAAAAADPDQVVLVVGRPLAYDQVNAIEAALADKPGIRLDAFMIDTPPADQLEELIKERKGNYAEISVGKLRRWDSEVP